MKSVHVVSKGEVFSFYNEAPAIKKINREVEEGVVLEDIQAVCGYKLVQQLMFEKVIMEQKYHAIICYGDDGQFVESFNTIPEMLKKIQERVEQESLDMRDVSFFEGDLLNCKLTLCRSPEDNGDEEEDYDD